MIKYLTGLLLTTSIAAQAQPFQTTKPVICDRTDSMIRALNDNWQEHPVWTADDSGQESRYALFVNLKTGSWTMLQMTPKVACIIGEGQQSNFRLPQA